MKIYRCQKKNINQQHREGSFAEDSHYSTTINEPALIYCGEKLVAGYFKPPWDMSDFTEALKSVKYEVKKDPNGVVTHSRQFGTTLI
jgi:hypothetical protein